MALTEAELKNHTVAQLKTLLTEKGLPTDGLKATLLARLVEHESSAAANGSAPPAEPVADAAPAAAASTPAPAAAPAVAPAPASSSAPAQSAEEKAAADEAKRATRAAKFGAVPDAEKPSLNGELAGGRGAKGKAAATPAPTEPAAKRVPDLDKPLGDGKRGKGAKADAPTAAATAPAAKPAVDPAVAAAEEEKKRKRAERFGAPDAAADAKRPKV